MDDVQFRIRQQGSIETRSLAVDEDVDVATDLTLLVEHPPFDRGMRALEGGECLANVCSRDFDTSVSVSEITEWMSENYNGHRE